MISIRTGLVVAGFVGMGLTSAAEYLAETVFADPDSFEAVDAVEAMPGKALRLTENSQAVPALGSDVPCI